MGVSMKLKNKRRRSGLSKLISTTFLAAGGWLAYSNLAIKHNLDLPAAIAAERKVFHSPSAEKLSYYVDASSAGRPLVLLHSINAAASAYEMRPLFEHYRSQRPVYALDLPGYGFSDRSDRVYTPQFFQGVIQEFLASQVGEPADVVALSLTGEFAAIAAQANPSLFHSLVLLSPTGLSQEKEKRASQKAGRSGSSKALYPVFAFPLWSQAFYDLIATRASIRYFLQQSFLGPVPDTLIEYAYRTAHQPGAKNVPLHFISGKLFTPDILTQVYQHMRVPGLMVYDHDAFTGFERLPYLLENSMHWKAVRIIPTNGLPHWEQLPQTAAALDAFWADLKGN
jgi:pimeloyl-ACP methyl ester carboxylesterase